MTKQQIEGLINKAKEYAPHSFVPYTQLPTGACALTADNIVFGGASIENEVPAASIDAVSVAIIKAVSEGNTEIKAVCLYRTGNIMPYINGIACEIVAQFGANAEIILANDEKHETYKMFELLPNYIHREVVLQ